MILGLLQSYYIPSSCAVQRPAVRTGTSFYLIRCASFTSECRHADIMPVSSIRDKDRGGTIPSPGNFRWCQGCLRCLKDKERMEPHGLLLFPWYPAKRGSVNIKKNCLGKCVQGIRLSPMCGILHLPGTVVHRKRPGDAASVGEIISYGRS